MPPAPSAVRAIARTRLPDGVGDAKTAFVSPAGQVGEMLPDGSPVAEGAAWEPEP